MEPFAQSIAYFDHPVIKESTPAKLLALYCDKPKAQIKGTMALDYIETRGEQVFVKQKNALIEGYHNKTRIQRANRKYWYDIKSNVERRGRAPILIPRLIYRDFCVLWNQADFIPGGAIIEFIPTSLPLINQNRAVDIRVYLAVLNSSLFEVNLRNGGQVYGGGTNNISVSRIGETLVLNVLELTIEEKHSLIEAYEYYITDNKDRSEIDRIVFQILNWGDQLKNSISESLEDLLQIAYSAKVSGK